jgi:hypothetical protein
MAYSCHLQSSQNHSHICFTRYGNGLDLIAVYLIGKLKKRIRPVRQKKAALQWHKAAFFNRNRD